MHESFLFFPATAVMVSAVTISVGGFQTGIPTDKSAQHQKASYKQSDGDVTVTVAYRMVWHSLPSGIPVWPRHLYMERTNQLSFVCVRERERACGDRKEIKLRRGQENKDDASCSAVRPDGDPWIFQSMNSHGRREPRLVSAILFLFILHVGPCL